jgi:RNA polymerase sigma factor (sigma-70 family)
MSKSNIDITPDLYQRIAAGEQKAFSQVHQLYKYKLAYYATQFMLNWQEVEEIVSDAFIQLWNARAQLKSNMHVKNLLYFGIRNKALQLIDSKNRKQQLLIENIDLHQHDLVEKNIFGKDVIEIEMLELLQDGVSELPKDCRKIFELLYYEQKSPAEIGGMFDIEAATVRSQKRRAIMLLRSWVAKKSAILLIIICFFAARLFF